MKKNTLYILLGIFTLVMVAIGSSYAIWIKNTAQTDSNTLITGCFNMSFTEDTASTISLNNAFPLTNQEGLTQKPYTFKLINNCAEDYASYQINLEVLNTTTLPSKYVKVAVNNKVVLLGDQPTTKTTVSDATTSYIVNTGTVKKGETKNFTFNIWLDESVTRTTTDAINKAFEAKITINTSYSEPVPPTASEKIIELAQTDTTNLAWDGTVEASNLRYIGANPNNYVTFNGEEWRIIGSFKDIDDGTGRTEWRTKIIRTTYSTNFGWDAADVNDWATSSLNAELNGTYLNGLSAEAQGMIGTTKWDINKASYKNNPPPTSYAQERGGTTWTGKIGLMYPSDYGYATGGSTRSTCLNTSMYDWDGNANCYNNDWLFNSSYVQWTITGNSSISDIVLIVDYYGAVSGYDASFTGAVRPVLYLSSNVSLIGGSGTSADPYTLKV